MDSVHAFEPTFVPDSVPGETDSEPGAPPKKPEGRRLSLDPTSPLFRHEAIEAYERGEELSSPLAIVPLQSRVVLGTFTLALAGALAVLCLGQVEITSRCRGVVRAEQGVQPLFFPTAGVVREVLVREGDAVRAGQPIARLETASLVASLTEAEAQLRTVVSHAERERVEQDANYVREATLLTDRAALTRRLVASLESSTALLGGDDARVRALQAEGLATAQAISQSSQAIAEEERRVLAARADLAKLEQDLVVLRRGHEAAALERSQRIRQAEVRRDAARQLLEQTTLVASREGRVESLMVTAGEATLPTTLVARLVPAGGSDFVTAFVPERDRAFVSEGSRVQVEFDQLPVGEFGSASARLLRISTETAGASEIAQALGAAAPAGVYFRVELKLEGGLGGHRLAKTPSSGSLLTARITLRKRRMIGFVFDPVREWLD